MQDSRGGKVRFRHYRLEPRREEQVPELRVSTAYPWPAQRVGERRALSTSHKLTFSPFQSKGRGFQFFSPEPSILQIGPLGKFAHMISLRPRGRLVLW